MAKEAITSITNAEANGKALRAKARENADKIAAETLRLREELIASKVTDAEAKAAEIIDAARKKASELTANAKNTAEKEAEQIRQQASVKESKIISEIPELL